MKPKKKVGFAAMSPERLKEVARQGGHARKGRQWNRVKPPDHARKAPPTEVPPSTSRG